MTTKTKIIIASAVSTLAIVYSLGIYTAHTAGWKNLETYVRTDRKMEAVNAPMLSEDEIAINAKIASPEFQTLMRQYATGLVQREKQLDLD